MKRTIEVCQEWKKFERNSENLIRCGKYHRCKYGPKLEEFQNIQQFLTQKIHTFCLRKKEYGIKSKWYERKREIDICRECENFERNNENQIRCSKLHVSKFSASREDFHSVAEFEDRLICGHCLREKEYLEEYDGKKD